MGKADDQCPLAIGCAALLLQNMLPSRQDRSSDTTSGPWGCLSAPRILLTSLFNQPLPRIYTVLRMRCSASS